MMGGAPHTHTHTPVYGDVFQELVGGAVVQHDSLRGNLQRHLRGLLPTGFSLPEESNRGVCSADQKTL